MALYSDASFPFQIRIIEYLILIFALRNSVCFFKKPVGQGTLTMVDMSYYAEITDVVHQGK
jgi:hypothetical protein